jgi:hypothetical protein
MKAVPFLSRAKTLLDFAEMARSFSFSNPHTPRAIGFALARAGRSNEAVHVLDQVLTQMDREVQWQRAIANQSKYLRDKLIADPDEAQRQLRGLGD